MGSDRAADGIHRLTGNATPSSSAWTGVFKKTLSFESTSRARFGNARTMSKTLLYSLALIGDLVLAYIFFRSGRTVVPIILVFAALCFGVAAVGSALGKGGPKA